MDFAISIRVISIASPACRTANSRKFARVLTRIGKALFVEVIHTVKLLYIFILSMKNLIMTFLSYFLLHCYHILLSDESHLCKLEQIVTKSNVKSLKSIFLMLLYV